MARAAPNNERNVLVLAGVSHFATHFFELMYPAVAVALAAEIHRPVTTVLGWSFLSYLLFGLGALPAGILADKFGARRVLLVGLAGSGVFALAVAEAAPGRSLVLCLGGLGLFASFYHPAGMNLIAHTLGTRGRALGINGVCGHLGFVVAPLLAAFLATQFGWRHTYHFVGFAACALAALLASLRIRDVAAPAAAVAPPIERNGHPWVLFALLCVAAMLAGVGYRGAIVVQPAYFAERVSWLGFGAVASLVYLVGIAGRYVSGMLADRYDPRWLYLGFHAASLPMLLLMTRVAGAALVGTAALFAFFSLGMQPIENSLFTRFAPPRWRGATYGVKFALTFGVGSLAVRMIRWTAGGDDLSTMLLYLAGVVAILVVTIAAFITLPGSAALRNTEVPVVEPVS